MKIVFFTEDFAPTIGGVQTIVMELARGLVEWHGSPNGNSVESFDVTVATRTPRGGMDDSAMPFRVLREPTLTQLFQLFRRANVIHLAGASMVPMAIGLSLRKPVVVEHHGYQAVCPSGNYLHEPDKTTCPGHFQNGNYAECFRCGAVEASRFKSARNLTLLFPRRWLATQVAANVAVSDHNGRRVALPDDLPRDYGDDIKQYIFQDWPTTRARLCRASGPGKRRGCSIARCGSGVEQQ